MATLSGGQVTPNLLWRLHSHLLLGQRWSCGHPSPPPKITICFFFFFFFFFCIFFNFLSNKLASTPTKIKQHFVKNISVKRCEIFSKNDFVF
jgi:hypothetical protein